MPATEEMVARAQNIMANAWMVRTFIKHCDEVEDFPELMTIVRAVFDVAMALETRLNDSEAYMKMLAKKIGRLRKAADKFRVDAPLASTHTNFKQAIISIDFCIAELADLLESARQ